MNDVERAIEVLKYYKPKGNESIYERGATHKDRESFNLAISALEKQIPQMGIPCNSYKNHNFVECGACNRDMGMYYQYCPHCGQKAKWRDKYE